MRKPLNLAYCRRQAAGANCSAVSRVTDMGFVSGSPETGLQPQRSTFLVRTSFLSPKGAGLWTVDWQFQREHFPHSHRKQWAMPCAHAPSRRDGRYASHALSILCVFQVCVPSLSRASPPCLSLSMPDELVLFNHTSDAH